MLDLKISRIRKGLSQKQLADILGMSPSTICRIETGKIDILELKISTLKKISKVLEISVSELLDSDEEE
ncbi:helix-turn-helix transcriptional regulator [Paraclostridium ghonii]|uniref:helix-turn-helix domain-containing protein n=1 Tax=Paraclostridium ghonii TaxID=29358 RepID=UPI00202D0287|nr:helix-turn-helix transcriptional regulator [Paeniclostridium ghonii]MCM0166256.1 helix-turn-helix domain-containing protein [Paeniclostridium ghonii]